MGEMGLEKMGELSKIVLFPISFTQFLYISQHVLLAISYNSPFSPIPPHFSSFARIFPHFSIFPIFPSPYWAANSGG